MENFEYYAPTRFYFGKDQELRTGSLVKEIGAKKVLIVYGRGSAEKSGLLGRIEASLDNEHIGYCTLSGVKPNPEAELVLEGIKICREEQVDMVLGIGGGSVIDTAKNIAGGASYDGDFWDLMYNPLIPGDQPKAQITEALPHGLIVTVPASGSEAGQFGGIYRLVDGKRYNCGIGHPSLYAKFAILNPELTYTLSPFQTAAGSADIFCHAWEKYLTATDGVDFTDGLLESIMRTVLKNAPIALREPNNYDARSNLMWAATSARHEYTEVGRSFDFSTHMMETVIGEMYDATHGAALAVLMPASTLVQYKKSDHLARRFAQMFVRVFGIEADYFDTEAIVLEGIDRMKNFFAEMGLPSSLKAFGAKEEDIPELVERCPKPNNGCLGELYPLTREELTEIYTLACS